MGFSFSEVLAVVTVLLSAAGVVANIWVVNDARVRAAIFIGLGMGLSFVFGVLAWPLIWQPRTTARNDTPAAPTTKERPTPPRSKPTPEKVPSAAAEEPAQGDAVPLYASSFDSAHARSQYCVVGDFNAEARQASKSFDVTLTGANVSLCNYSSHGPRKIKVRVGYRGKRRGEVLWSRPVTLIDSLQPGQTLTLSDPVRLSVPKRGMEKLSEDNFVVELINVPYDTNREMRYSISSREGALIAQLKEP
jgi:hypothetical protein